MCSRRWRTKEEKMKILRKIFQMTTMIQMTLKDSSRVRCESKVDTEVLKSSNKMRVGTGRASRDKLRPISAVFDLSKKNAKKPS